MDYSRQNQSRPSMGFLSSATMHLAKPSANTQSSFALMEEDTAASQMQQLTQPKLSPYNFRTLPSSIPFFGTRLSSSTSTGFPTFQPQVLDKSPFALNSENGTCESVSPLPTQNQNPTCNMAMKILQDQERCKQEGRLPSGFGCLPGPTNLSTARQDVTSSMKPTVAQSSTQLMPPPQQPKSTATLRQLSSNAPRGTSAQNLTFAKILLKSSNPTHANHNQAPLNLSRQPTVEIVPCNAGIPTTLTSSIGVTTPVPPITSKKYQNQYGSQSMGSLYSQQKLSSIMGASGAQEMQVQHHEHEIPIAMELTTNGKNANEGPIIKIDKSVSPHLHSFEEHELNLLSGTPQNDSNDFLQGQVSAPSPLGLSSLGSRGKAIPPTIDRMETSVSASFEGDSSINGKHIELEGSNFHNQQQNRQRSQLQHQQSPNARFPSLNQNLGHHEMEVDQQPPTPCVVGKLFGHDDVDMRRLHRDHPARANNQRLSDRRRVHFEEQGRRNLRRPVENMGQTVFKGLTYKPSEGGLSDQLIDKLEEKYLKCRNMVVTKYHSFITPLQFLKMICTHMGMPLHHECFYLRVAGHDTQYRCELFTYGFCGVGHAVSPGFSTQLAAAHLVERIRIFFRLGQLPSYALYPGCRYTKIKSKLRALCETYTLGNLEFPIRAISDYYSSPDGGPRYECSCVVGNQEACVRSDSSFHGSALAAKNMYLHFVKPPAVPGVELKDYFAIGAECPMLKEIHPSLLLAIPSENKVKWMKENNVASTDVCLQEPKNESSYLMGSQLLATGSEASVSTKIQSLIELKSSLLNALEWIEQERQGLSSSNTAYGSRQRQVTGIRNTSREMIMGGTSNYPGLPEDLAELVEAMEDHEI